MAKGLFGVPKRLVEDLRGGGDQTFPEGEWLGELEKVTVRELPSTNEGQPFAGYATTDGEELNIQLGNITPVAGEEGVGNRKMFTAIVLRDGNKTVEEVNVEEREAPHWKLQRSAIMLANLASALGQTEEVDGQVVVTEGFVEALRDGGFTGQKVGFITYHRKAKTRGGDTRAFVEIQTFFPAP